MSSRKKTEENHEAFEPVIEKGIPVAPRKGGNSHRIFTPLRKMKVGDSILYPSESPRTIQRAVFDRTRYVRRVTGRKFITRQVEGGIRVWCVANKNGGAS